MNYEFFLDLHGGRAAVVENMTPEQRAALRIDTPLAAFITTAASEGTPSHIVITGNAGDGKTFAALQADAPGMTVIVDASARMEADPAGLDPIEALANRIASVLSANGRLLLAINRGQLDRLARFCRGRPGHPAASFAALATEGARTRPQWDPGHSMADVTVIDLGLFDTTGGSVLDAMLDNASVVAVTDLSPQTLKVVEAAQCALRTPHVRAWVKRVVLEVAARGGHLTMRQLWSFVAFLLTGGRAADSQSPPSLADSVGARLFRYEDALMFEDAILAIDPAYHRPRPDLARKLLIGSLAGPVQALVGLTLTEADRGEDIMRALSVHDPGCAPPDGIDNYQKLADILRQLPPGWVQKPMIAKQLLQGVYKTLRLWQVGGTFPAWQALCYDSSRLRHEGALEAATAANASIDPARLRLALPRAHPSAEAALEGAWRPPHIWLAFGHGTLEHGAEKGAGDALRLTPRLFRALHTPESQILDPLSPSELLSMERWLARAPRALDGDGIRVSRASARPLRVTQDDLSEKTRIEWEGPDAAA